jgi:hypothetical protein
MIGKKEKITQGLLHKDKDGRWLLNNLDEAEVLKDSKEVDTLISKILDELKQFES